MTRKKQEPKAANGNDVRVQVEPGTTREAAKAKIVTGPCLNAAVLVEAYGKGNWGELDFTELHSALLDKAERVHGGNMREVESTLVAQATALDSMFTNLARRAVQQDMLPQFEAFMRLALRAQNQSRMTLETLATIKNPPIVFAKQANIAAQQQVNNGALPHASRARGENNPANRTFGGTACESGMDGRRSGANGSAKPSSDGNPGSNRRGRERQPARPRQTVTAGRAARGRYCAHWHASCASNASTSTRFDAAALSAVGATPHAQRVQSAAIRQSCAKFWR